MIERGLPERSTMQSRTSEAVPAVRLEHVSKSFGSRRVLDDVSFDVPAGCGFVILGRSGTGKSVAAAAHHRAGAGPTAGSVFVQGQEVSALTGQELSRGFASRSGSCFRTPRSSTRSRSARTWRFPCDATPGCADSEIRSRAQQKLAAVGLEREYDKMPAALSGGMRKRAGLARALALDPPILLVDEPSAGLDPITSDEIDTLLLELKQKGGTTHHRRHTQHPERAPAWGRARDAARGPDSREGHRSRPRPERQRAGPRVHGLTVTPG